LGARPPVAELNFGVVAKIDLDEIRKPFIKAGIILFIVGLLIVGLGAIIFYSISNPMIRRILDN
jgi:hypothetical protein